MLVKNHKAILDGTETVIRLPKRDGQVYIPADDGYPAGVYRWRKDNPSASRSIWRVGNTYVLHYQPNPGKSGGVRSAGRVRVLAIEDSGDGWLLTVEVAR